MFLQVVNSSLGTERRQSNCKNIRAVASPPTVNESYSSMARIRLHEFCNNAEQTWQWTPGDIIQPTLRAQQEGKLRHQQQLKKQKQKCLVEQETAASRRKTANTPTRLNRILMQAQKQQQQQKKNTLVLLQWLHTRAKHPRRIPHAHTTIGRGARMWWRRLWFSLAVSAGDGWTCWW